MRRIDRSVHTMGRERRAVLTATQVAPAPALALGLGVAAAAVVVVAVVAGVHFVDTVETVNCCIPLRLWRNIYETSAAVVIVVAVVDVFEKEEEEERVWLLEMEEVLREGREEIRETIYEPTNDCGGHGPWQDFQGSNTGTRTTEIDEVGRYGNREKAE